MQESNLKNKVKRCFGGSRLAGKRKEARPLHFKSAMHFVLKSDKARGNLSFVNHRHLIEKLIQQISHNFKVKVYGFAVNFDHIHLVVLVPSREIYKKWIRAVTSLIVQLLGRRTNTKLKEFFTLRPYSMIVSWGRQFKTVMEYLLKNQRELFGIFRPTKPPQRKKTFGGATNQTS